MLKLVIYAGILLSSIVALCDISFVKQCCADSHGGYEGFTKEIHNEETEIRYNLRSGNLGQRQFWHSIVCDHVPSHKIERKTVPLETIPLETA